MDAPITKNRCVICNKEKASFKCEGCMQTFCSKHVNHHRQELHKQLDEIEVMRDLFRQTLTDNTSDLQKHPLIKQINEWEQESIEKIRQTADEARKCILKYISEHTGTIEIKLTKLTDQLRENREEDFVETDLNQWKNELSRLEQDFVKKSNVSIQQDSTVLINKIVVQISNPIPIEQSYSSIPNTLDRKWKQNGISIIGGNGEGGRLDQLSLPYSISIDDDQTVYVADCGNDRIVSWKSGEKDGTIAAGGNGKGDRINQLNSPSDVIVDKSNDSLIISDRDNRRVMRWSRQKNVSPQIIISNIVCCGLALDRNKYIYVTDTEKHEVKRWRIGNDSGTIVAGGNGKGSHLNQLNCPIYIFVDQDHSVYVSDSNNHRVMKWMKNANQGVIVAGGNGKGNSLAQLSYPSGIIVDDLGQIYVADCGNDRVMRWDKEAREGTIIAGGNGSGEQLSCPIGLSFDQQGNLYVIERNTHRVQKFDINSN